MKLHLLHETTLVGAIAFKPSILGKEDDVEVSRPHGHLRWYLSFANSQPTFGLMEDEDEDNFNKSPIQFGDQTTQPKKLVWQPMNKKHSENRKRWYYGNSTKAKPPRQSSPDYPPPDKDHSDFILK